MDVLELIKDLEDKKLDYVIERSKSTTDSAGYTNAGISKSAFYHWGKEEIEYLNNVAQQLKRESASKAMLKMQDSLEAAIDELIRLSVKARSENVRLSAIVNIAERTMGKVTQKTETELSGKDDKPIIVKLIADE